MKHHLQILLIASLSLVLTMLTLVVFTHQRQSLFEKSQFNAQKAILEGASYAISQHIAEEQKNIHLFVSEYQSLISQLYRFPADKQAKAAVQKRLKQRFYDYFSFTVTDHNGHPLLPDHDNKVGSICKKDILKFLKDYERSGNQVSNDIYIHPNPNKYHYDVMLGFSTPGLGVFVVSFNVAMITEILKTHQVPGHELILVRQSNLELIEITAEGAKDTSFREEWLSSDEVKSIKTFKNIDGTDWRLIDVQSSQFLQDYHSDLWKEAIIISVIVLIATLLMMLVMNRAKCENNQ